MKPDPRPTVSDVGEETLIARITGRLGGPPAGEIWSGDDAAVIRGGPQMVLTTDMVVEGVDFERSYASGVDVGYKAIAVNVSDVIAMAALPAHAVCAVAFPPRLPAEWVDDLTDGLVAAAQDFGVALVGGDVGRGSEVMVSVAMTGIPAGAAAVTRWGAAPGDLVCVTGELGAARAGLEALRRGAVDADATLLRAQLRPSPPIAAVPVLARWTPTAMLDLSDGLARDLGRLLDAAGVGCDVEAEALPIAAGVERYGDPLETAVVGGEDYQLLFTMSESVWHGAERALAAAGTPARRIGMITAGDAIVAGKPLDEWRRRSWEHLA